METLQNYQVLLKRPTDEACRSFQAILTNPHYYSDVSEDGDVCYTVCDASEVSIRAWIEQAKTQGLIDDGKILDW